MILPKKVIVIVLARQIVFTEACQATIAILCNGWHRVTFISKTAPSPITPRDCFAIWMVSGVQVARYPLL
jgi:hypothetical protein